MIGQSYEKCPNKYSQRESNDNAKIIKIICGTCALERQQPIGVGINQKYMHNLAGHPYSFFNSCRPTAVVYHIKETCLPMQSCAILSRAPPDGSSPDIPHCY